ncbi:DUF2188 domain-containing protein [Serratia plymuthica]
MAKGKDQHVTTHPDGWQVIGEGNSRATVVTATKQEAIDAGREIARNQESELVIHNRDGKISNSDSHGHDPNPPKDTK